MIDMFAIIDALKKEVAVAMERLESGRRVFEAIGKGLTAEQQESVSAKIIQGPDQFIDWLKTKEGQQALREFADKFIKS